MSTSSFDSVVSIQLCIFDIDDFCDGCESPPNFSNFLFLEDFSCFRTKQRFDDKFSGGNFSRRDRFFYKNDKKVLAVDYSFMQNDLLRDSYNILFCCYLGIETVLLCSEILSDSAVLPVLLKEAHFLAAYIPRLLFWLEILSKSVVLA